MANQPTKYRKFVVGAASAALVASAVAPVASAAEFKDTKGNTHEKAINALVEAGIVSGYPDGTFLPNKTLTRSDVVKFMGKWLVSLGYEVPEDYKTNPRFTDQTSKTNDELLQYSALVKDHGVFNGYEDGSLGAAKDITRENMAIVLVKAYDAVNDTDLVAFVAEQDFKKDVTDRATAKAEARPYIDVLDFFDITNPAAPQFNPKATTTRGQFASFLYKTSTTEVEEPVEEVVTATKVESVSATNLKEIVVTFDGTVDKATAEDEGNYTTNAPGGVASAELSADGKSVTLTLGADANGVEQAMKNQTKYKVSVNNVKAGDKVISVKDFEFMPLDNTLPSVQSVSALGNKAIKVVMSEPVKTARAANFKIDDKSFYGSVTVTGNEIVLKPYDASVLSIGNHKVTVSLVEDYNTLKSLQSDHTVTVVEDKEGPTVAHVEATLERVVITFSEDIDPATVSASDVYWMTGGNKRTAVDFTRLAGNKYAFDFTGRALPGYETTLYIDSVSDWSGNVNAQKEVKVTATVDQTRPEVVLAQADTDNPRKIRVKFSKAVQLSTGTADKKYFTVLDKDGKVIAVRDVTKIDSRTFDVGLFGDLSTGNNTLKISGVKDTTVLENTMFDYSTTITLGDIKPPTVSSVSGRGTTIVVTFSEKMDLSTISNAGNYLINFKPTGGTAALRALPSDAEITPINDGRAVLIELPEEIGSTPVVLGTGNSVSGIQVMNAKDLAGNTLYTSSVVNIETAAAKAKDHPSYTGTDEAVMVDRRTIQVYFDQPIGEARKGDFTLANANGAQIESVQANGTNVVTIKTDKDLPTHTGFTLKVSTGNTMKTVAGNNVQGSDTAVSVYDGVAPEVAEATSSVNNIEIDDQGKVIKVTFTEALSDVPEVLYAGDIIVNVLGEGVLTAQSEYKTAVGDGADANKLIITLTDALVADSTLAITVKSDLNYIQDTKGNKAVGGDVLEIFYDYTAPADTTAPKTASVTSSALTSAVITLDEALTVADNTDVKDALEIVTSDATIVSAIYNATAKTITVTFTNGGSDALAAGDKLNVKAADTTLKDAADNKLAGSTLAKVNAAATAWEK